MRLYVEGGGDSKALHTRCREGFRRFLESAGLRGNMPRIVSCGGRQQAFDDFCTALRLGTFAMLLVDSEAAVTATSPWRHLLERDQWQAPDSATNDHCHLMVQCMESWLVTDRAALQEFFGQGFNRNALPAVARPIESIEKREVYDSLALATKDCKTKSTYGKGEHSFLILARIDPAKVCAASPWARRFLETVKQAMQA